MSQPTYARVDLGAIEENLRGIRARVGDRLILSAVKADAYGHGAVPVARHLAAAGVTDRFGVATVAEGLELRRAGVELPILKLSPCFSDEVDAAVAHGITLTVVDATTIDMVAAAAGRAGVTVPVHLKIDTGMGRLGERPERAADLAALIDDAPNLDLEGLFSHLAVADVPAQDEYTAAQTRRFAAAVEAVTAARGRPRIVHLANSAGVLAHPDTWFDMVRPGIMIYGSYPDAATPRTVDLRPALAWSTRVSFVKDVVAGETVSYGRTWTAPRATRIATIPVGYGDGYNRRLSNTGRVLIEGRSYPIAGRVCMDQFMVDLGPGSAVSRGAEVVLVGRSGDERITTTELADLLGTISYEVTCAITRRVPREYVPASGGADAQPAL
ncbi:alanine racemase [Propionicicella superfundia]|uniref:alanine racemase n=1 Tax=Propionicicella superfundia TaxID=348582 RepID=UPI0005633FD3|nr:alanine racemase [Propionicicella superfundia]